MTKKYLAVFLAVLLCLGMSGCSSFGFDAQTLMSPPKSNADQQAIHKLLQGNKTDITFIYPKSGAYRSAIIMQDFTGDGVKDAIGFYLVEGEGVEVKFLIKVGDEWQTAATFSNPATQVDRVCFGDLTGNGAQDVLIGWGSAAGTSGRTAALGAYLFDGDGSVKETLLGTYGEMTVTDLDGDGVGEVFTADKFLPAEEEGGETSPAQAKLYACRDGSIQELYRVDADNSITSYSSVATGQLTPTLRGVVLDGAKADGSMTTQVFYFENGRLVNAPPGVNSEEYLNLFSRPSTAPFLSRDINGDGLIEIPVVSQLPGIPEGVAPDSTSYLVEWSTFERDSHRRLVLRALMNLTENYWFRLPYDLVGRISASNDAVKRTVTYTEAVEPGEDGVQLLGSPLFSIRVFTRSAWESRGTSSGYEMLASQSDLVYGIQVLTKDSGYLRSIEEIKRNFKLISE